jgi:hypothetical protein
MSGWKAACTSVLIGRDKYEQGYEVACIDNPRQFKSYPSCNGKPSASQLAQCNATPNCYNLYNETDKLEFERKRAYPIPKDYNSVCLCTQEGENAMPKYQCKPITDNKSCGPLPPVGFCKKGGAYVDPYCVAPLGGMAYGPRAWVCPGAVIPAEIAKTIYPVKENNTGVGIDKKWFNTFGADATTIYPTINMDGCTKLMDDFQREPSPFNQLTSPSEVEPAWISLQSEAGFVNKFGENNPRFIPFDRIKTEDDKFIRFNNRITDNTRIVDLRDTNKKYTISQFMDMYNSSPDPLKELINSNPPRYKVENIAGLTNSDQINRYVTDFYDIHCAAPINNSLSTLNITTPPR